MAKEVSPCSGAHAIVNRIRIVASSHGRHDFGDAAIAVALYHMDSEYLLHLLRLNERHKIIAAII